MPKPIIEDRRFYTPYDYPGGRPLTDRFWKEETHDEFSGAKTITYGVTLEKWIFASDSLFINSWFSLPRKYKSEKFDSIVSDFRLAIIPYLEVTSNNNDIYAGIRLRIDPEHKIRLLSATFLFSDGSLLTPEIQPEKDGLSMHLRQDDYQSLLNKDVKSLRLESKKNEKFDFDFLLIDSEIAHLSSPLSSALQRFIQYFLKDAKETYDWQPLSSIAPVKEKTDEALFEKISDFCFVYLMCDRANGLYKIGISQNPDYRESTLQGEKPTIEKICAKRFPSRKMALAIESSLHRAFAEKRVRGEWFRLDEYDVWQIQQSL